MKMGHVAKVQAIESNTWDLENTFREIKKEFATDLRMLITETTSDPKFLETLVLVLAP